MYQSSGPSKPRFGGKTNKFGKKTDDKKREGRGGPGGPGGPRFFQKKTCRFCAERSNLIDFKDVDKLRKCLTEKGKIMPRRITGTCAKCQRSLVRAVKRARHSALIAFQID